MNFEISEHIEYKIKSAENGDANLSMLRSFNRRANNKYNRGVLHGYLLALSVQGVIDNADAIYILDQIDRVEV